MVEGPLQGNPPSIGRSLHLHHSVPILPAYLALTSVVCALTYGKMLPKTGDPQVFVDPRLSVTQGSEELLEFSLNAFLQLKRIQRPLIRTQLGFVRFGDVRAGQKPL
jgi:hypothetical protein